MELYLWIFEQLYDGYMTHSETILKIKEINILKLIEG